MIQPQDVITAQHSKEKREELIARQSFYICRCAARAAGRWVDTHDDLYSIAIIAFNDAISSYRSEKGSFSAFADRIIRNRIIDAMRREKHFSNMVFFSSLTRHDHQGNEISFDIEDPDSGISEAALEIDALQQELIRFSISFFDLPESSPKLHSTKKACIEVIRHIVTNQELLLYVFRNQRLPAVRILQSIHVNEKILQRYRKYIIAGILICSGDYPIISEYFEPNILK